MINSIEHSNITEKKKLKIQSASNMLCKSSTCNKIEDQQLQKKNRNINREPL